MANKYKVHIGHTPTGRDKWYRFDTLDEARTFCARQFDSNGLVLSIVEGR